jgi:hypothetical protein
MIIIIDRGDRLFFMVEFIKLWQHHLALRPTAKQTICCVRLKDKNTRLIWR